MGIFIEVLQRRRPATPNFCWQKPKFSYLCHPENLRFSPAPAEPRSPPGRPGSEVGSVVQLVRMPPCHGGGRGFESRPVRKAPVWAPFLFVQNRPKCTKTKDFLKFPIQVNTSDIISESRKFDFYPPRG